MGFYQIGDLERLSGIKAHTIRIWEKRYAIIEPYRSDTNIRYYDDVQLKKLLNVAGLVRAGYKISSVAAMDYKELKAAILQVQQSSPEGEQYEFFINGLLSSMLMFDEVGFNKLYDELLGRLPVADLVLEVLYPFLHKTGLLWSLDDARPVQEHFASALIRRKLYALIDQLPKPVRKKKFLVFLPAGEWHDLPLLFAEYLIRSKGYPTVNLAQNVPFADVLFTVGEVKPSYLFTIITSSNDQEQVAHLLATLGQDFPAIKCLLSGRRERIDAFPARSNLVLLHTPKDILKFL